MALFRTAIVAAAVVALLPSDRAQQERLQQAALDAAQWTMTFCDRNAKTCAQAGAAWEAFKTKAEFAAGVAYDVAVSHLFKAAAIETASIPAGRDTAGGKAARGTLTDRDLEPDWRGPAPRKGI